MNGLTGSGKAGYELQMSPRRVLEKGSEFDFDGFAYLVPRSEEARMQEQMRQGGLSFLKGGRYFGLYTPLGPDRGFDVDFQIIGASPARLQRTQIAKVYVIVTNRSRYPWQSLGNKPTWPAYQVLSAENGKQFSEGMRTPLPEVIFPGDRALVGLAVRVDTPGRYIIRLAMVQDRVAWFLPKDHERNVQFPVTVE